MCNFGKLYIPFWVHIVLVSNVASLARRNANEQKPLFDIICIEYSTRQKYEVETGLIHSWVSIPMLLLPLQIICPICSLEAVPREINRQAINLLGWKFVAIARVNIAMK